MSTDATKLEEIKARGELNLTDEQVVGNLITRLTFLLRPDNEAVFNKLPSGAIISFRELIEKHYEKHLSLKDYLSNLLEPQKKLVLQKIFNENHKQSALWSNRLEIRLPEPSLSAERKVSAAGIEEARLDAEVKQQTEAPVRIFDQLKHILTPGNESNFQYVTPETLNQFRLFLEKEYETHQSLKYYLADLLEPQKENVLKFFPEMAHKVIWRNRLGLPALLPVELKRTAENAQVSTEESQKMVAEAQAQELARITAEKAKKEQEQLQLLHQQQLKAERDRKEQQRQRDLAAAAQRKAQEDAERRQHRGFTKAEVMATAQRLFG